MKEKKYNKELANLYFKSTLQVCSEYITSSNATPFSHNRCHQNKFAQTSHVTSRLTPLTSGQEKLPWRSRRLGDRPGQESFPGDRDGWEKPLRGLLEGLKGKASVTGRRMKNFGVGETSGTSFERYGPVHGGYIGT
ncbi:unnamed protein product [Brassica oleracea var. botrytis]|uniref:(rape) hypothetical protein n=1 Tax=Brassica napus TaxID=3708 RepID=A0A816IGK1_BRANA|nr:unnamed protein product [Brassica napus]